jgi:hypothetical protein
LASEQKYTKYTNRKVLITQNKEKEKNNKTIKKSFKRRPSKRNVYNSHLILVFYKLGEVNI